MKKSILTMILVLTVTIATSQIMGGGQVSTDGEGCTWVKYPQSDPILISCDPNYGQEVEENTGCDQGYWSVVWIGIVPFPVWIATC